MQIRLYGKLSNTDNQTLYNSIILCTVLADLREILPVAPKFLCVFLQVLVPLLQGIQLST